MRREIRRLMSKSRKEGDSSGILIYHDSCAASGSARSIDGNAAAIRFSPGTDRTLAQTSVWRHKGCQDARMRREGGRLISTRGRQQRNILHRQQLVFTSLSFLSPVRSLEVLKSEAAFLGRGETLKKLLISVPLSVPTFPIFDPWDKRASALESRSSYCRRCQVNSRRGCCIVRK
jgi:hypothetical protein